MSLSHKDLKSMLPFYAANQLTVHEQELIEHHLAQCPDCDSTVREWESIAHAVQQRAHRATSLPTLHMPQRRVSPSWRFTGITALIVSIFLFFVMQFAYTQTHYTAQNPTPTVVPTNSGALPVTFHADNYIWEPQGWNNQGPANLVQVLRHFGWQGTQDEVASVLKPNRNDKYVTLPEMIDYVNTRTTLAATSRVIGTEKLLRQLIAENFGVITAIGFELPDAGWVGHYLTLTGYDDAKQQLFFFDTYMGNGSDNQGIAHDYQTFDEQWMQFNRAYMVIYPKDRGAELLKLLGADSYIENNYLRANAVGERDIQAYPGSFFPYLNMCEASLHRKYNIGMNPSCDWVLSTGKQFLYRVLLYRYELLEANYKSGQYPQVIMLANLALTLSKDTEELYYWRGMARAAQGKFTKAVADIQIALRLNPNFKQAQEALVQLKGKVDEF